MNSERTDVLFEWLKKPTEQPQEESQDSNYHCDAYKALKKIVVSCGHCLCLWCIFLFLLIGTSCPIPLIIQNLANHAELAGAGDAHMDACSQEILSHGQQYLFIALVVTHIVQLIMRNFRDQYCIYLAHTTRIWFVSVEEIGKAFGSLLHQISRYAFHFGSRRAWAREELVDKEARESVLCTQSHGFFEIGFSFCRKTANDVCGYGYSRYSFPQKVHYVLEVLPAVFPLHFTQNRIAAALKKIRILNFK